jgi:hypothetical protein
MAVVLAPAPLERFLLTLAQVVRAEGLPGVRSVHERPPDNLGALPALVAGAGGGAWEEPGFGDVPVGCVREIDTVDVVVYSDQGDAPRARQQLLPVQDALRRLIGRHKTMRQTCQLCRPLSWRVGVEEYAEQPYHALVVTLEARFHLAGEFAA